jgi:hypothetical protein
MRKEVVYRSHPNHGFLDPEARKLLGLLPKYRSYLKKHGGPAYSDPAWIKEFKVSPRDVTFRGAEGVAKLREWQQETEKEVIALLQRRPWGLLHTLGLLRRLPQDQFFLGEKEQEGDLRTLYPYSANVTELAVLKYARWDMAGTKVEAWPSGPEGFPHDRPSLDRGKLAEIIGLAELMGTLAHLYDLEKQVARGGTPTITARGLADARPTPELKRRLVLHERRNNRFSFLGATAGTFHPSDVQRGLGERMTVRVERNRWREDEGREKWEYPTLGGNLPKWDKRFGFYTVSLEGVYEYLKLLEAEVVAQYGLSPELIVASLMATGRAVLQFLSPNLQPEKLTRERLIHLDRKGYILFEKGYMDKTVLGTLALGAFVRAFPGAPRPEGLQKFAHGFKRLAYLESYRKEDLSLKDGLPLVSRTEESDPVPMPPPFIYPAGSYKMLDLNGVSRFVDSLFTCLDLSEEWPRQTIAKNLEKRLGEYFDYQLDHPLAFESSKVLKYRSPEGKKRDVAELDASLKVGEVLVAIDAKSIRTKPGYKRYEYKELRNRWSTFESYVEKADEQAKNLTVYPKGTNYDLVADGYTHVVTLLCSATPEYIDSNEERFYIRDDLPRIATPLELRDYLNEVTEEELKSLPFAKHIGRP